jgi:membrane associated rhomboid family serine protease
MLIPFRTDAPIYYWPFATVGLIVVNTLAFFALAASDFAGAEDWILQYGRFNPVQWVTSNFVHGNLMHLLGNMFFLWGFGLVVEGKLGWWKFLVIYLGIGMLECAAEQTVMLGAVEGGGLGASSILYGLMAMAMIWAPKNELGYFFMLGFRAGIVDLSILTFAMIYIALDLVTAFLVGFAISTPVLHLMGGVVGLGVGIALLKLDQVDCENWDLFAVWADRAGKTVDQAEQEVESPQQRAARVQMDKAKRHQRVHELIAEGEPLAAYEFFQQFSLSSQIAEMPREDLLAMIKELLARERHGDAIAMMVDFLHAFPNQSTQVRLRLAQVLILQQQRPNQALRVLEKIPAGSLNEASEKARRQLVAQATRLRDEGTVMELASEDW